MNIFISYSSKDYYIVKEIAEKLKCVGHSVWIDRQQLLWGQDIVYSIKQGINDADVVLSVITENYNNSSYASAELGAVLLGKSNRKLLPVVIGETNIPFIISDIGYIKYDKFNSDVANDIVYRLENLDFSNKIYE